MEYSASEAGRLYGHYLDKYISEVNRALTKEQLLADMNFYPIAVDGSEIGIVGINTSQNQSFRTAIIRMMYIDQPHRGKKMGPIIDGLLRKFKELGFTHAEGWSYPAYAKHIAKRYGIEPKIVVFHEPLESLLQKLDSKSSE